jgi:hypothetical protein
MQNHNDWLLLDEDEEEIELSVSPSVIEEIRDAVVFTLDWSVGSLLEQLRAGSIDLQPQYQRRDAWTVPRKSKLIESLILGLPVPQLVLAELRERKGAFLVLDGKQRLTALLQFAGGMPTSKANGFRLTELPVLTELNGVSFEAMNGLLSGPRYLAAFLNQPIRTVILRGWKSEELLHLVFHRLNSNVVPLSPQELRQALIRGPFLPFLSDYSAQSQVLQQVMRLSGPDFRMRDTELLLRLLAFSLFAKEYRGDLRRFLDAAALRLNQSWDTDRQRVETLLSDIESRIDLWASALGGYQFVGRRYRNGELEPRINRAVLDAQVAAAANVDVRKTLAERPADVAKEFKQLFASDADFARAVESTTKTTDAVRYRAGAVENAILGLS